MLLCGANYLREGYFELLTCFFSVMGSKLSVGPDFAACLLCYTNLYPKYNTATDPTIMMLQVTGGRPPSDFCSTGLGSVGLLGYSYGATSSSFLMVPSA